MKRINGRAFEVHKGQLKRIEQLRQNNLVLSRLPSLKPDGIIDAITFGPKRFKRTTIHRLRNVLKVPKDKTPMRSKLNMRYSLRRALTNWWTSSSGPMWAVTIRQCARYVSCRGDCEVISSKRKSDTVTRCSSTGQKNPPLVKPSAIFSSIFRRIILL